MNRCPSRLTFFHCPGFPGSGPCSLNKIFGVPAWNVGVVVMSTAITSQSLVMKYISLASSRQKIIPIAPFFETRSAGPAGASGLLGSNGRTLGQNFFSFGVARYLMKEPTTTSLFSSLNPSTFGQSVAFTANVSSANGTPTGTVEFSDGGVLIGPATLSGGVATFTTSA